MKLWKFGTIINGIVLCTLYTLFLLLGYFGVDKFIAHLPDMGNSEEAIRSFLTVIKIDLVKNWDLLVITISILLLLLFLLGIIPFILLSLEKEVSSKPNILFYTVVTFLSLPFGGGILMLFGLSNLKKDILKEREWYSLNENIEAEENLPSRYEIENDSDINYIDDEINQSEERGDKFNDYFKQERESIYKEDPYLDDETDDYEDLELDLVNDNEPTSYQPGYTRRSEVAEKFDNYTEQSHDKIFGRINATDEKIREVEKDTSMLKEQLIKIENELDRMENNYSERAKEISLRRKLREIEYDLEDNKNYLEKLRKRQF